MGETTRRRHSSPVLAALAAVVMALAVVVAPVSAWATGSEAMYRLYNQWTGDHMFTTSQAEYDSLAGMGWTPEGVAWQAPLEGEAVYRLYNPYSGDHFYTTNPSEYASLGAAGWSQEGVAFHSADSAGKRVYRLYNRWLTAGTHLYTTDRSEYDYLRTLGWRGESIAFFGVSETGVPDTSPIPEVDPEPTPADNGSTTPTVNNNQTPQTDPQTDVVWVTPKGKKFHRRNCSTLNRSRVVNSMTRQEAIASGRGACKVCKP